jgi:hypothetical protein
MNVGHVLLGLGGLFVVFLLWAYVQAAKEHGCLSGCLLMWIFFTPAGIFALLSSAVSIRRTQRKTVLKRNRKRPTVKERLNYRG